MDVNNIFNSIDKKLLTKFKSYHLDNQHVYVQFKTFANQMKSAGKAKYSAWTIINKIRWDEDLKSTGDPFKINNDFIALYARLMIYHNPDFIDFFELRSMKAFDRRDSAEERYRNEI